MLRRLLGYVSIIAATTLLIAAQPSETEAHPISTLLPESTDTTDKKIRAARAKFFDIGSGTSLLIPPRIPPGAPPPPPPGSIVCLLPLPELPIDESDVVVVGEVSTVQPFLTSSQTSLYTEYTIQISEMVKSSASAAMKNSLIVLRRGGTARLDTGRVIAWNVHGEGDHYLRGETYLFFLTYRPEQEGYHVLKVWRVKDGVLKAAYPNEIYKASQFLTRNENRSLAEVVQTLKDRVDPLL
ncbi:MAG TPA: hypothetical protein VEX68_04910 [Bryobacteraceae bacterium]|nr:hypothetical protein [Bryobacteraceae bacterium]